jgi:N-acetylmuramic acid 6-phosphate (MurNAc-6-P) etherase
LGYDRGSELVKKPAVHEENTMSKKPEKATLTSAAIEEQTAAFLKSGGSVEYVGKGRSGQLSSTGAKQVTVK